MCQYKKQLRQDESDPESTDPDMQQRASVGKTGCPIVYFAFV